MRKTFLTLFDEVKDFVGKRLPPGKQRRLSNMRGWVAQVVSCLRISINSFLRVSVIFG
jgi:hypothetical protein